MAVRTPESIIIGALHGALTITGYPEGDGDPISTTNGSSRAQCARHQGYRSETQRREFDRRSAVEGIFSNIIVYRFGISTL